MSSKTLKKRVAWILIIAMIAINKGMISGSSFAIASEIEDLKRNKYDNDSANLIDRSFDDKIFGGNGGSDSSGNNKIVSATFEFASLNHDGYEGKSIFYYSDDFFKNLASDYNSHLSTTSIELAISGVANNMENNKDKYGNLKDFMSKMGFQNITPNSDYLREPENNTMGAVCANKPIHIKNGSEINRFNLFVVAMRSANYKSEWESNFTIGQAGDHQGFSSSRDIVYEHVTNFYNEHKDDFGGGLPVKLWVVGYSRGAGVANMLGGKLTDNASAFNTTKENIYCYTLGTPRGAAISEHTSPSLDSYTNIHNIVSEADLFQLVAPTTLGFDRYGVDHEFPYYLSEKVHDASEKQRRKNSNRDYLAKYNEMLKYYNNIDPPSELNLNDFHVNKLILASLDLKFLEFTDLSVEPFTDSSPETNYYQSYEFYNTFINKVIAEELLNCEFPGADYGDIKGRERLYTKYQDLIVWLAKTFLSGGDYSYMVNKIQENALGMMFDLVGLLFAMYALVYTDAPQDRTHYRFPDEESVTYYYNVYDIMDYIFDKLLDGAVSSEDYDFLMSRSKDITDFLLDLLIIDYRTTNLTSQTAIGSLVKNISSGIGFHLQDGYLAWLMSEDSYYQTPPVGTVNVDGNKSVVFTNLNNSVIKIYDGNDNYIGEYNIDNDNNVTATSGLDDGFINVVKSYNPEGMELRLPSSLQYKAEIIATNSSIGNGVYREYFIADSTNYRKVKDLGSVYLSSGESYVIEFKESGTLLVYSCYAYDEANDLQKKKMQTATVNEILSVYGKDYYSFASDPITYKKGALLGSTFGALLASASNLESVLGNNNEVATESEVIEYEYVNIASESETEEMTIESDEEKTVESDVEYTTESAVEDIAESNTEDIAEIDETIESDTEIEVEEEKQSEDKTDIKAEDELETEDEEETTQEEKESSGETEISETEIIETENITNEDEQVSGLSGTETLLGAGDKVTVNFESRDFASLYYFDGTKYVKTESGNSFDVGTKIKIAMPLKNDTNVFCGWTLKNSAGDLLNKLGIDTPRIEDLSTANENAYSITLKDYDINISANYILNNNPPVDPHHDYDSGDSGHSDATGIIESIHKQIFGTITPTKINADKVINATFDESSVRWYYNPITNKWQLDYVDSNGNALSAVNGFYELVSYRTVYINNVAHQVPIKNIYYFDENGNMATGFVETANKTVYYFEEAKTLGGGKMVVGWKNINGSMYYFNEDGSMLVSAMTLNDYLIGSN